ncbi:NTP transferase domain-containing protein [Neobacillus sp. Marseille-QA0830]
MNNQNKIAVVYLAAGMSRRMGVHKLGLPLGETTIGNMALESVVKADVGHVFVTTSAGDDLKWIHPSLFEEPFKNRWTAVPCQEAVQGMAHSLKCGLQAAMGVEPAGFLILLADQPLLSVDTIQLLLKEFLKHPQEDNPLSFIAASFQGIPRPPVIFLPSALSRLFMLKGDEGARKLLQGGPLKGKIIECEKRADFVDIDTIEDYQNVKGALHGA